MKLYFLYLSALTVGALCKIDDVCIVQVGNIGVEGKCQKKGECMKAGLAAFSRSGRKDISGSVGEVACPGDGEVQCCIEIKCGAHTCRNNVESNPCAEGVYVANFRDRNLCPSSSSDDNVQCCVVENAHNGLKRRQVNGKRAFTFPTTRGSAFRGSIYKSSDFSNTPSNGNNLDMSSASGTWSTLPNNDAAPALFNTNSYDPPSADTGFSSISPIGASVPTTPDTNIALAAPAPTTPDTNTALAVPAPTTPDTNTALAVPAPTTPDTNIALAGAGDVSHSADDLGALPVTSSNIVPTVDTSSESASLSSPPGTDVAFGGGSAGTGSSSSNFNLAQIDNYSQSAGGLSPGKFSTPDEGLSVGLNRGLQPAVTYTNGGGSTFSLGPTTSVTNMLSNFGASLNGVQGGFSMGFRKLKRSLLADDAHY